MEKRKVIFRADASPLIGMGHFIRTLALAEMLKDDFYCVYATQCPTEYQIIEIEKICHIRIDLPNDETHYNVFLNLLTGNEIVILDNYYFTIDYHKAIKAKGSILVCIDDMYDKEFFADLIINHAPGIKQSDYKAQVFTQYALGLEYALIRSAFLEQARKQRSIEKLDTVMICFGGADPMQLTKTTLQAILHFTKFKKIIVITGAANQFLNDLKELIESDNKIVHRHSLNQQEMLQTMQQTDLAIVPTSGIIFELMTVGVAIITGYYVDNQQAASANISSLDLALNLGNLLDHNYKKKLADNIDLITIDSAQAMVDKQKQLIRNSKSLFLNIFRNLI